MLHHELLKYYQKMGLKIKKVHRMITFDKKDFMKDYILFNTKMRMAGKTNFEKNFYKLMNNSLFGKDDGKYSNRVDIRLTTRESQFSKLVKKSNYRGRTVFSENLVAVHMGKTKTYYNKPIYLGMAILDLSKLILYDFHYGYIKKKYGEKARLLFTDTDSLTCEIETEDFYKDITPDVKTHFDTSEISKDHPSGIPSGLNKKVLGMFKDETNVEIFEFRWFKGKVVWNIFGIKRRYQM